MFRVGIPDYKWRTKQTKCCYVSGLVNKLRQLKTHGKCTGKNAIGEHRVVSTTALPKKRSRFITRKLGQTSKAGNMRRLETIKDKSIFEKIVMIFVTQNNFQNGPGNFDRLLGFYPDLKSKRQKWGVDHCDLKFVSSVACAVVMLY